QGLSMTLGRGAVAPSDHCRHPWVLYWDSNPLPFFSSANFLPVPSRSSLRPFFTGSIHDSRPCGSGQVRYFRTPISSWNPSLPGLTLSGNRATVRIALVPIDPRVPTQLFHVSGRIRSWE
ncbi:unnamed protein product, partial [Mycena citricolor]